MRTILFLFAVPAALSAIALCTLQAGAADWPMLGRDGTRNAVSPERHPPIDWSIGYDPESGQWTDTRNIKWQAQLGDFSSGSPIVADGQVYVGTSNSGRLQRYPNGARLGCLLCFRAVDGEFLWQFSAEKLPIGLIHDWPMFGINSMPLVEGQRMWFVSNRSEVVCLDTQGFRDQENDGPYVDEPVKAADEADVVWRYDLIKELGVFPHADWLRNMRCSPASYRNRIYVVTGNGVAEDGSHVPAPEAPSLVCFDKETGKVLWKDASPGENILLTQVSSPLVIEIDGRGQVIVGQGDGWVRSFDALTGELIWEFDINPKESEWKLNGRAARNSIPATPVFYEGRVYVGSGQDFARCEGPGRLVCIDPTKSGDISSELAVDANGRALPHRRVQAVVREQGEKAIPNPNSGLVWEYTAVDQNGNGEIELEEEFHRTLGNVVIDRGLLIAGDGSGFVHCFDARTGRRHWVCDLLASVNVTSPLIVDGWAYVPDEDGDVGVFRLSPDPNVAMKKVDGEHRPLAEIYMGNSVFGAPAFANGVLYIASKTQLWAIAAPKGEQAPGRDE